MHLFHTSYLYIGYAMVIIGLVFSLRNTTTRSV